MRRLRRTSPEVRMEMTPLLDVIFLLLTFFVFSLVLMVRANVLGVSLPGLSSAEEARGSRTVTVTLDAEGRHFLDGRPADPGDIVAELRAKLSANPGAKILIAADTGGRSGTLLELVDRLSGAGLRDFALVGTPTAPRSGDPAQPTNENAPGAGAVPEPE